MTDVGFGPFLRQLRRARDLTAKQLAAASGISASYLLRLERGEAPNPSLAVLGRLGAALDVRLEALAGGGGAGPSAISQGDAEEVLTILRTLPAEDLQLIRGVALLLQRRGERERQLDVRADPKIT